MEPRYKHLLSPIKVGKFVLKNRVTAGNSLPHFLQGPEPYPAAPVIAHFANKAKGAAMVTCMGINNFTNGKQLPMNMDMSHFPDFDLYHCSCQNYLLELTDTIHFYHSLAGMSIFVGPPSFYPLMKMKKESVIQQDVNGVHHDKEKPFGIPVLEEYEIEQIEAHKLPHEYEEETLDKIAESYAEQAAILKMLDFDMLNLHFAYRANLPAKFMSPITNRRTDQWGGSLENRMRFPLMVLKRIRDRIGQDMLLEMLWSAEDVEGGYTLDESVAFLREASKYIDIVQLRTPEVDPAHPTGFTAEETPFLHYAAYVKERVDHLLVATIGGYQDLELCDKAIADGKADLIVMSRAWLSNTDLGQLMNEGRGEDIVPCLRCNKCHGGGEKDPFHSICSVNPVIGLEHKVERMILPTAGGKNIGVVGGGPAGLRCAMYLADRGHQVTVYEATGSLGGAIKHSDYAGFKWPLRRYKNFLMEQVAKRDQITVKLNTYATAEMLQAEGYDSIVAAVGAKPVLPPIPGLQEQEYVFAEEAFEKPESLGRKVVIIGGGEVGVEVGIHLAQKGRHVTVLEMRDTLAADTTKIHYRSMFENAWLAEPNFHWVLNARVTSVEAGKVTYKLTDGADHGEQSIAADSIVVSAGRAALTEEALAFYGISPEFRFIGDCDRASSLQHANRTAFAAAMTL